jgi:hypothetical protein
MKKRRSTEFAPAFRSRDFATSSILLSVRGTLARSGSTKIMFEHDDVFVKLYQQFKEVAMLDLPVESTCIRTFAAVSFAPPAPTGSVWIKYRWPMQRSQFDPASSAAPLSWRDYAG